MLSSILIIVICLILAPGHIWWGYQHPIKEMAEIGNPTKIVASYHACWYHISILLLATATVVAAHAFSSWANPELLWFLWATNLAFLFPYLGVVYHYPSMRRLGWGQITLIIIMLINLGVVANTTVAS
jgi:hypothetical protein